MVGLTAALCAGLLIGTQAPRNSGPYRVEESPAASTSGTHLTAGQASARARITGEPVVADAMTTPTSQTTANPDGTYTLTTSAAPVRAEKDGSWVSLDATLAQNSDGTYSPTASTGGLVLSGGGSGPLAVLTLGGHQMSVTLPVALPTPSVVGDTASYNSVLPDTDLIVTATEQGGYSDVFVLKNPAAASNPALTTLMHAAVSTSGLTVSTDATGDLTAADSGGAVLFTAPAATAWDSSTKPTSAAASVKGATTASATPSPTGGVDPTSGAALTSSVDGPGEYAHTASLDAAYSAGTLSMTPPAALLTDSTTDYPVYLDPSVGPTVSNWTMVNSAFPTQSYWDSGTKGHMQVGYNGPLEGCSPCFVARSFTTLDLSHVPTGAVVSAAQVNFWEDWAPSCNAREVDLYRTGTISPPGAAATTWGNQPSWSKKLGSSNAAKGYDSSCSAGGIGFNIKDEVASIVSGGGKNITLGLRASDESDEYGWKQFNGSVSGETPTNASVTYDLYPNVPTGLRTSPKTTCAGSAVGDTSVSLYAQVSSPVRANLTTAFDLYKTGDSGKTNLLTPAHNVPDYHVSGASGQPAVFALPESFFKSIAGSTAMSFTWQTQSTDGTLTSGWSKPCTFLWDPTRPGDPDIEPTANADGTVNCPLVPAAATNPIGTTCEFTLSPPAGTTITGFVYQVNDNPPVTVSGTGPVNIAFALPTLVNTLTAAALSTGGNIGSTATVWFDGKRLDPPASDGDVNFDGTPDLIIPGQGGSAFPPGLWLATGHGDGTTTADAINVGTAGLWSTAPTATSPTEWNGAQAITGNFCGNGAQDVLAYFPGDYDQSANPNGSGGAIVCSNGNASPLDIANPADGSQYDISPATIVDSANHGATQIANGGTFSGVGTGPDLLATIDDQLYLFTAGLEPATYTTDPTINGPGCISSCIDLSRQPTPDGTYDWNSWVIASAQDNRVDPTTGATKTFTDLYLWKPASGALYLWTGLKLDDTFTEATQFDFDPTHPGHVDQYTIRTGTSGSTWPDHGISGMTGLIIKAADINHDGVPELWAIDSSTGIATAYLPKSLSDLTLSTASTTVNTSDHAWLFQDIADNNSGDPLTTSADSAGSLTLQATTGVQWNTGDLYQPDVLLNTNPDGTVNTSGTGRLFTQAPAVSFGANDFSASVRVQPNNIAGTVLSQDGTATAGFTLAADKTTGDWTFCMPRSDTITPAEDCATGGAVQPGEWAQLTATYNHATGAMALYVNGIETALARHVAVTGFSGDFQIGDQRSGTGNTSYFSGQIADVHTWNLVAPPAQPLSAGNVLVPVTPTRILDTRNGTGGTTGPVNTGTTVVLPIAGNTTVSPALPSTGISAVALSVTATAGTGIGHLTVYPDGTPEPDTSAVNFPAGTTVTNGVIVPIGPDGKIDITNSINAGTGSTQILADVTGYFTTNTTPANASKYTAISPKRILDTRTGTGAPKAQIAAAHALALTVAGANNIPATGVTAVAINITIPNAANGGPLIAYPDGTTRPATTALTFHAGDTNAAESIVPVGADGKIDIYNDSGAAIDIVGDVVGYFKEKTVDASGKTDFSGQLYHPLDADRITDTRISNVPLASNATQTYTVSAATAVNPTFVVNLTATQESTNGYLTVCPTDCTPVTTSTLDYDTNTSVANLNLTSTTNSSFTVHNTGTGTTHVIIDTNGYFANY